MFFWLGLKTVVVSLSNSPVSASLGAMGACGGPSLLYACQDLNLGFTIAQQVLLTAEPSLQPLCTDRGLIFYSHNFRVKQSRLVIGTCFLSYLGVGVGGDHEFQGSSCCIARLSEICGWKTCRQILCFFKNLKVLWQQQACTLPCSRQPDGSSWDRQLMLFYSIKIKYKISFEGVLCVYKTHQS